MVTRSRVHTSATVPDTGSRRSSASMIVTWDPDADLADVEESIKQAARSAITRARVVHRIESRPAPSGQLPLPLGT